MRRWAWTVAVLVACSFEHGGDPTQDGSVGSGSGSGSGSGTGASVTCPGMMCGAICCDGTCSNAATSTCDGRVFHCDGPEDCASTEVCCNNKNGSVCTAGSCGGHEACHGVTDCGSGCDKCSYESDYGQQVCCE